MEDKTDLERTLQAQKERTQTIDRPSGLKEWVMKLIRGSRDIQAGFSTEIDEETGDRTVGTHIKSGNAELYQTFAFDDDGKLTQVGVAKALSNKKRIPANLIPILLEKGLDDNAIAQEVGLVESTTLVKDADGRFRVEFKVVSANYVAEWNKEFQRAQNKLRK